MRFIIPFVFSLFFLAGCEEPAKEILIATKPAGATVYLASAKAGTTPMKITVSKETKIEVKKEGYISQGILLSAESDHNLVVDLEKAPIVQKQVNLKMQAYKPATLSIAKLQAMYRQGEISKSDYAQKVNQAKYKMKAETTNLIQRYKQGEMDKSTYSQKLRQIRHKYQG